jgi:hypothetical protein
MKTSFTTVVVRACVNVPTNVSSFVQRMVSRTVIGRGLHIHINQHFGYTLHLVWNDGSSEKCMERDFLVYDGVLRFCTELKNGTLV